MFRCPVCASDLDAADEARVRRCCNGHAYDVAREGYLNLLAGRAARHRAAGDDADMVRARRTFLDAGHYDRVRHAVLERLPAEGAVLDIGCGEGRYTLPLDGDERPVGGIDLSKPAVRLAARRASTIQYAVASAYDLPVHDGSIGSVVDVFGPVVPAELTRILRPDGVVVSASPAPEHLIELKRLVLETADEHGLEPPRGVREAPFAVDDVERLTYSITVEQPALDALLAMTPYAWRTTPATAARLSAVPQLDVTVDVLVTRSRRVPPPG